jgi:XTP/dITP diphosphohydrolase
MRLLLSTQNAGKATEVSHALADLSIEIVTLADLGLHSLEEESGTTYAENALLKARHGFALSGLPTIADDSGIEVEALAAELGLHTRRWGAGPDATDATWIAYFLQRMEREVNRRARFTCALALVSDSGERVFLGTCDGQITRTVEVPYLPGFPLSSCFVPDGYTQVYNVLGVAEKERISHRGRALQQLKDYLRAL